MDQQIDLKNVLGVIGALTAFVLLIWVLRRTIGWSDLLKAYRYSGSYTPMIVKRLTTCWMNGIRGSYNIGANSLGLYVSFPFPLNVSRPPIVIPWTDINIKKGETLLLSKDVVDMSFKKVPNTCFQIKTKIYKDIAAAVGNEL